jgi:hypothetical protein
VATRTFFRTIIKVEVLSENPVAFENLCEVSYAITEGDCSGKWGMESMEEVNGRTMAKLLQAQGSDPSFFQLGPRGKDLENSHD